MFSIFIKSFLLIFLAELGDKTQLTALTMAAGNPKAKWVIFLGSAIALTATSLLAVLFGDIISKIPNSEKYIKYLAGAVFILFGVITIIKD